MTNMLSPWYNRNGWLGVKHQVRTDVLRDFIGILLEGVFPGDQKEVMDMGRPA